MEADCVAGWSTIIQVNEAAALREIFLLGTTVSRRVAPAAASAKKQNANKQQQQQQQQVPKRHSWPENPRRIQVTIGSLPEEKITQSSFNGGSNKKVRIRSIGCVHVPHHSSHFDQTLFIPLFNGMFNFLMFFVVGLLDDSMQNLISEV
ncbi:hypothetical protein Syun_005612 [Stephania yunnanensis]|uniref:Uncharacterized protein n=1 Tax=Stephania yunnanensis TaxID=152371 RepID=A0AAP0Q2F4_9MAGN